MTYSNKCLLISRRQVFSLSCAVIGVGFIGRVAHAEGGRDPDESYTQPISTDEPSTKSPGQKIRVVLTKANYHKVSPKGLRTAIKGIDAGDDYRIEGFSKKMSRTIFEMTLLDRKRTLLIFKKMLRIKTQNDRQSFLLTQEAELGQEINDISEEIKPKTLAEILFDDGKEYTDKLKARRKKLKAYKRLLHRWIKKPMEGRLTVG